MKTRKVEVIIKGKEEDKQAVLLKLLEDASEQDLRRAFDQLRGRKLISIARAVHGRIYLKMLD